MDELDWALDALYAQADRDENINENTRTYSFDGTVLQAETPVKLVQQMYSVTPMAPEPNEAEWMKGVAERAAECGRRIRCDTAANFVADIMADGSLLDEEGIIADEYTHPSFRREVKLRLANRARRSPTRSNAD